MREDILTLDQYLLAYGTILGQQAQENLNPLHDPATEKNHPRLRALLRKPYPPQAVVITAAAKALRRQKSLFLIGECGCVAGETLIHDPVKACFRRVDEIDEDFHVIARDEQGNAVVAQAVRPFLKGRRRLYRVTLSSGESFVCTDHHRLLTEDGWLSVREACGSPQEFDGDLPLSSGDIFPLDCAEDAPHSMQTAVGSTACCSDDSRRCDGQPLSEAGNDRASSPLQADVHGRFPGGSREDDLERRSRCTHHDLSCDHPSTPGSGTLESDSHGSASALLPSVAPWRLAASESPTLRRSQSPIDQQGTLLSCAPAAIELSSARPRLLGLWGRKQIVKVDFVREDYYYDFTVEKHHSYALAGVWHHNTGKTMMGQAVVHCHAGYKPYRALVFCPGQLVRKWKREIEETIPGCYVKIIERCSDLLPMASYGNPKIPEWYIIGRDTAKLGPGWRAAANFRKVTYRTTVAGDDGPEERTQTGVVAHCPRCGKEVRKTTDKDPVGRIVGLDELAKKRMKCEAVDDETGRVCGEALWQHIRKPDRFEPAKFIHKQLRRLLDYLIVDELHENKGADTAQANAVGSLAAASRKVIAMTGTLIGGYAEHLRPLLFRLSPGSLVEEGFGWKDAMPFTERYGRVETVITEREEGGAENKQSRGSSTNKAKYCRPGIMPTLFGAHLIGNAVFLGLTEMNAALPTLREFVVPIEMDPELAHCYGEVESVLKATLKQMLARRDKRLLGAMLQTLMAYPDHPFAWNGVGYKNDGAYVTVCEPPNLSPTVTRPKERKLLDIIRHEAMLGRQVWVYVQLNGKHDVESRVARLVEAQGYKVKILKTSIPLAQREEWIDKNCADVDVVISHPKLVETGLDLFSKSFLGHNFCTLVFYETGYVLPTMRQASRRAWRLMQPKECKVYYLYYEKTMQERAMELMGKKLLAAEALEGKFSSEGLVAMAGDDGIELAMAKSLAENMNQTADRSWQEALSDSGEAKGRPANFKKRQPKLMVIE